MAEYSPWRLPAVTLSAIPSSSGASGGAACPLFYPVDDRALRALAENPPSITLPTTPLTVAPGPAPPPPGQGKDSCCPTAGLKILPGDSLRLFAWGGCGIITVSFNGRMLLDDGTIQHFRHQVVIQNDNVIVAKTVQPGAGTLIDFTVSVPVGTTNEGALYGEAWLGTLEAGDFFPYRQVVWGRVIGRMPLSAFADAGTRPEPQSQRTLLGQEQLAINELAYEVFVNGGVRRELTSIRFRFNSSAVVANRRVFVYVTAFSGFELWRWYDPNVVTASQEVEFSLSNFSSYTTVTDSAGIIHRSDKLPNAGIFQSPFFINIVADNRKAGDLFSIFDFWTEEI